jgi:hypothetical protein
MAVDGGEDLDLPPLVARPEDDLHFNTYQFSNMDYSSDMHSFGLFPSFLLLVVSRTRSSCSTRSRYAAALLPEPVCALRGADERLWGP